VVEAVAGTSGFDVEADVLIEGAAIGNCNGCTAELVGVV
jgi:hypothetical protein